jgi:hypothetical protein
MRIRFGFVVPTLKLLAARGVLEWGTPFRDELKASGTGVVLSQVPKARPGAPFSCAGLKGAGGGSCYPRSENPDLGHPFLVLD